MKTATASKVREVSSKLSAERSIARKARVAARAEVASKAKPAATVTPIKPAAAPQLPKVGGIAKKIAATNLSPSVAAPVVAPLPRMTSKTRVLFEKAAKGIMPPKPNFEAETHARFRNKLAELHLLVRAKDVAALRAFAIKPISTSPKMMARYRDLAIMALDAKAALAQG